MSKDYSKDVLNVVKKKTGKSVSSKEIYNIASGVKPSTVKSEEQLRQLIKQISSLVNVPVSDKTTKEIIHAIKSSNINPDNMEQMIEMMMGKSKS